MRGFYDDGFGYGGYDEENIWAGRCARSAGAARAHALTAAGRPTMSEATLRNLDQAKALFTKLLREVRAARCPRGCAHCALPARPARRGARCVRFASTAELAAMRCSPL